MDKKIPIYFDTIVLDSPVQQISYEDTNACRLHVGVFTKYKNRNGSYITDEYADFLIRSATRGNCPVVGFFDPEEQDWASHTGPKLANGYGYVESFDGWTPFQDTDGETRDYATFSIVLFTDYYDEANKIKGQHQSMELDPKTIDGDWANFDGEEYFVYTKGNMLGLCVIGSHEPCFSVSHFFSKNDDTYKSQYEKFSSLLFKFIALVEEAENNQKGGEQQMDENKVEEVVEEVTPVVEEVKEEPVVEEPVTEFEETKVEEEKETEPTEFEKLQAQFTELQTSYNELQTKFEEAQTRITELEAVQAITNTEFEVLKTKNEELTTALAAYAAEQAKQDEENKKSLIEKYEKVLEEEEIKPIKDAIKDFSYDELEGKLAIVFANKQIAGSEETKKVPLPEPEESSFAKFMKKYKK